MAFLHKKIVNVLIGVHGGDQIFGAVRCIKARKAEMDKAAAHLDDFNKGKIV